jgi:hypothetical protein
MSFTVAAAAWQQKENFDFRTQFFVIFAVVVIIMMMISIQKCSFMTLTQNRIYCRQQ